MYEQIQFLNGLRVVCRSQSPMQSRPIYKDLEKIGGGDDKFKNINIYTFMNVRMKILIVGPSFEKKR